MPDNYSDGALQSLTAETCPVCGTNVPDWIRSCPKCGHEIRSEAEAARAELRHIAYLQTRVSSWQDSRIFSSLTANQIQDEVRSRRDSLLSIFEPSASSPASSSPLAAPIIPPLPTGGNAVAPPAVAPFPHPDSSISEGVARTAPSPLPVNAYVPFAKPDQSTVPGRHPSQASRVEFKVFLQTHGLKLVFALATLLVVFSLRSIIAWQEVGAIAVRLIPAVLIGLTFMFWLFGQRTREENPWAAFVYHGMTALLVGFDIAAMNRYWLGAAGASLPLKPALLLACLTGTFTAGMMLIHCRQIPYLHLFQAGVMVAVYAVLQFLRLLLWNQRDFHAAPIALFGAVYLLLAALNFAFARRAGPHPPAPSPGNPLRGRRGGGEEAFPQGISGPEKKRRGDSSSNQGASGHEQTGGAEASSANTWELAWALWAHLAVAAVVVISSLNVVLQEHIHLYDFAALALLAGVIYALGAQMLQERRMTYVSVGLMAGGLLFWLADSFALLWTRFGFVLLALSVTSLALAIYNEKRADRQTSSLELARAWRNIARYGIFFATALTGFQILARWRDTTAPAMPLDQTVTGMAEAALSGVFLLMLARWENRRDCLYGALLAGGLALVSALEAAHAPIGGYALAFMLYGWALYGVSLAVAFRQRVSPRLQMAASPPIPSPVQPPSSRRPDWLDEMAFFRGAHVASGLGLIIAALLPMQGLVVVWAWTTATLVLGCALYALTAQKEASASAIYASLVCMGYASGLVVWHVSPHNASIADINAPFVLGTAILALLLSRGRLNGSYQPATSVHQPLISKWEPWREPLAVMSTFAVLASILNGLLALLTGYAMPHPVLTLLPACLAALLLAAGRREAGQDPLCSLSLVMLNCGVALEIGFLSGLSGGAERWHIEQVQNGCIGWLLQGWVFWGLGRFFNRQPATANWTSNLTANAMAAGLLSAIMMTFAQTGPSVQSHLFPSYFIMTGAFCLMFLQTWITDGSVSRFSSLIVVVLAAAGFGLHPSAGNPAQETLRYALGPAGPAVAIAMTVFFVLTAGAYFALAFRQQKSEFTYLALLPLVLGFCLFAAWKASDALPLLDRRVSEVLWLLAGIGSGLAYLKTARRRCQSRFAMLSALLLMATYCHIVSLVSHPQPQWHAFILLPLLLALYAFGAYSESAEEYIGKPFRTFALAASGLVLFWSTLHGDEVAAATRELPAHALVTWTLLAYGMAYAALALYRRSPATAGVGSAALTAAYVHTLLMQTSLWHVQGQSLLSWPRFSCLAILAGYAWLGLAWFLHRRLARKDLARPLLKLTGVLAIINAWTALCTHEIQGQGDWSLLTLACASILWLGLWVLETGEICWHAAAWNLLAGWIVFITLHLGLENAKADLFLLPFGIYLLLIGHQTSSHGHSEIARRAWWLGLLTILTPAFLLYWTNAPGRHEVLLIIECAVITLLGVVRRIRAYVGAGLMFTTLLTAASIIGHIPNYAGTLLALGMGVSLFIAGFYALTHRQTIQTWLSRLSTQWQAWQAWR